MADIVRQSGFTGNGLTSKYMRSENREDFNPIFNGRAMRPPLRTLYIFTVAKRPYERHNPPLFPKVILRGCENGERYVMCASAPDPLPQVSPDNDRGGTRVDEHDAMVALIDLLCPGNFSFDQFAGSSNPTYFANANGTNLVCEGFWVSESATPTEDEIRKAESMRDARYRWLTREAKRLANVSRKDLDEFLQRWPDTHIAMDALGMEADWHSKNEFKQSCPNCGDSIKPGLAFHQSSAGVLCVVDPERALRAGAIDKKKYKAMTDVTAEEPEPEQVTA